MKANTMKSRNSGLKIGKIRSDQEKKVTKRSVNKRQKKMKPVGRITKNSKYDEEQKQWTEN